MRDDSSAGAKGVLEDNTVFEPIHDAQVTLHCWKYGTEVHVDS